MTSPSEIKNLAAALLLFQADPPTLVKNKTGQAGNQKTRYADLVQVNETVLKRLNALGIIYTCSPTLADDGKFVLEYALTHVASGESQAGRYPLKLSENPQQMGSAISYARRYVLLAVTGVAAEDEDDDATTYGGGRSYRKGGGGDGQQQTAQRAKGNQPPLPGEQGLITDAQMGKLQDLLKAKKYETPEDKKEFLEGVIGHPLERTKALTVAEASAAIQRLEQREQPGGDV